VDKEQGEAILKKLQELESKIEKLTYEFCKVDIVKELIARLNAIQNEAEASQDNVRQATLEHFRTVGQSDRPGGKNS
jgi:hypothetical protein